MSKKKHKHPEHVNHERWLVSYADFITLLFAFFVVMFSASQVDASKTKKMALAINSAFNTFSIFKEQSGNSPSEGESRGHGGNANRYREFLVNPDSEQNIYAPQTLDTENGVRVPPTGDPELDKKSGFITPQDKALALARQDVLRLLEQLKMDDSLVKIHKDDRGVVISIREAVVFQEGTDQIAPESIPFLEGVGKIIANVPNQVRVEGHTDNQTSEAFSSNWDLSVARSSFIVKWLLEHYLIDPARFSAVGYGEYRPIGDNTTPQGRKLNRRVDVVLLSEQAAKKEPAIHRREKEIDQIIKKENPVVLPKFENRDLNFDEALKKAINIPYQENYSHDPEDVDIPTDF